MAFLNRYAVDVGKRDTQGPDWVGDKDMLVVFRDRLMVVFSRTGRGVPADGPLKMKKRYEQVGQTLAVVLVIRDDILNVPNEKARKEVREAFDAGAPMTACRSVTVLGKGFFASVFISLHSAVAALTRKEGMPHKIFTTFETTARWIHDHLDDPNMSPEEILQTLRWANARVDEITAAESLAS